MKWLFFSLVLVNVAFYLWATGHPDNAPDIAQAARGPINERTMVLLSERDERGTALGGMCMRIGPFLTQATFADASRMLGEMGLSFNRTAVSARKLKTWRVYAEVPDDQDALKSLRETLDSMDIDHYQFDDNGVSYLSVGLFSQAGDARNFVAKMKKANVETNYRPELRTLGPLRWIEVENLPDRFAREQLENAKWGDAMAGVSSFPCGG